MVRNELSPIAIVALSGVALAAGYGLYQKMGGKDASYPPNGLSEVVKDCPKWIKDGCGNDEYMYKGPYKKGAGELNAMFPADTCPDKCPDLSSYTNLMAEVLRDNPGLYEKLKNRKTKNGVTLAKCIKTGMDNPSHPFIKTCGFVAGDEESWEVFKELADEVVSRRHGGYPADAKHPSDLDWNKLSKTVVDPTCDAEGNCKYVLTSRIRTGRSVRGIRLPPSISFEERRELERVVTSGLCNLGEYDSPQGKIDLRGEYFPLHGSHSYSGKPTGMTHEKEEFLRGKGNLFQEPDSPLLLSSGMGRHWPDGRGVFHNKEQNFFVWVNEEDHMRIISMEKGDNIKKIFVRFATACNEVQNSLKKEGYDFMHSDHLGWILTCPSNLGTGLRAGAMINIPLFSKRKDFKQIAGGMRLQVRGRRGVDSASEGGIFDISNADRIGKSEITLVNTFIEGASKIIQWEGMLEQGKSIDHLVAKYK
jgi:creatine kinase